MTNPMSPRDPDAILAAWLEEGPDRLPEPNRRAIAVATRTTRQSRRGFVMPWRIEPNNHIPRLAMATVLIVAVAGGALYLLSPANPGVGGPTPAPVSPSAPSLVPTASPEPLSPSPSMAWEVFSSSRFGYEVEVPSEWIHSAPSDDLPDDLYPGDEGAYADRWDKPIQRFPYIVIAVIDPESETDAAWLERNVAAAVAACDASEPVAVTVGGATAERRTATCGTGVATELVLFTRAGRVYSIESNAATGDAETASAILDRVLESFTFTD
jgi:hypothetical protein